MATPLGKIASYYYLSYKTIKMFQDEFNQQDEQFTSYKISKLLNILTNSQEYSTIPVRHNEEIQNEQLSRICPIKLDRQSMDSPHTKANLLLQAHCSRLPLPIVDYYTDLKSVLDQVIRILQAMIDISAMNGSLSTTINIINLQQCVMQGSWQNSNQLAILSEMHSNNNRNNDYISDDLNDATRFYAERQNLEDSAIAAVENLPPPISNLPFLINFIHQNCFKGDGPFKALLENYSIHQRIIKRIYNALVNLPLIDLKIITIERLQNQETIIDFEDDEQSINYQNECQEIPKENTFKSLKELDWIELKSNSEYLLCFQLQKRVFQRHNRSSNKAYCPNFPKPKSESWYLVLGREDLNELITITRVAHINPSTTRVQMKFRTPNVKNQESTTRILYTIYLLSDSYISLDQQYLLPFEISL